LVLQLHPIAVFFIYGSKWVSVEHSNLHIYKIICNYPIVHPGHLFRIPDSKIPSISALKSGKQIGHLKKKGLPSNVKLNLKARLPGLLIPKPKATVAHIKKNRVSRRIFIIYRNKHLWIKSYSQKFPIKKIGNEFTVRITIITQTNLVFAWHFSCLFL
jgi:hypothetical protein